MKDCLIWMNMGIAGNFWLHMHLQRSAESAVIITLHYIYRSWPKLQLPILSHDDTKINEWSMQHIKRCILIFLTAFPPAAAPSASPKPLENKRTEDLQSNSMAPSALAAGLISQIPFRGLFCVIVKLLILSMTLGATHWLNDELEVCLHHCSAFSKLLRHSPSLPDICCDIWVLFSFKLFVVFGDLFENSITNGVHEIKS